MTRVIGLVQVKGGAGRSTVATKADVEPTPAVASFLQHLRILAGSPSAK
jgi:hypothetical protein